MKEYALYKGEDILAIGTIGEIAEKTGVKKDTVNFYRTQAYKKRLEKRKSQNARILVFLD